MRKYDISSSGRAGAQDTAGAALDRPPRRRGQWWGYRTVGTGPERRCAIRQQTRELTVSTRGKGLYDFTDEVVAWVRASGIRYGLLTLQIRHTSASLLIQENADPDVRGDLERFLGRLVPEADPIYRHTAEGPDDMPSHVRSALTSTTLSIPVMGGAPALGTWQGIYVFEHRAAGSVRRIAAHLLGE